MKKAVLIYISQSYIESTQKDVETFVFESLRKENFDCAFVIIDKAQYTFAINIQWLASFFRARLDLEIIKNFIRSKGVTWNVEFYETMSGTMAYGSLLDYIWEKFEENSVTSVRLEFVSNSAVSLLGLQEKLKEFILFDRQICVYSEKLKLLRNVSDLKNLGKPECFDVIFHILGQEPIPIIYALKEFKAKKHIFVASKTHPSDNVSAFVPKDSFSDTIYTDPFSSKNTFLNISNQIKENKWKDIGFNLTGGTKMMYDGAMKACRNFGGVPFYFEINTNNLVLLNSETKYKISGVKTVDDFFNAGNYKVSNKGYWRDSVQGKRKSLTLTLWGRKRDLKELYEKMPKDLKFPKPFTIKIGDINISWNGVEGNFSIGKKRFSLKDQDFVKYAKGGWFEEYVYINLMPLMQTGLITDMRIGYSLNTIINPDSLLQEFDILFTDSKTLYILECKSGNLISEHLDKLQNNLITYAGRSGKGALVSAVSKANDAMNEKILRNKNLNIFTGDGVPTCLKNILNMFNERKK